MLRDDFLRKVFDNVGTLAAWERFMNPVTQKPANFGFAHFATRDTALTASKVLNSLKFTATLLKSEDDANDAVGIASDASKPVKNKLVVTLVAKCDKGMNTSLSTKDEERVLELRQRLINEIPAIEEEIRASETRASEGAEEGEIGVEQESKHQKNNVRRKSIREVLQEEENVPEEEILSIMKIEPREPDIDDEIYGDLLNFRRVQAKDHIVSSRRRKRLVKESIKRTRDEEERRRKRNLEEQRRLAQTANAVRSDDVKQIPQTVSLARNAPVDLESMNFSFNTGNLPKSAKISDKGAKTKRGMDEGVFHQLAAENEPKKRKLVPIKYSKEEEDVVKTYADRMKEAVNGAIVKVLGEGDDGFCRICN